MQYIINCQVFDYTEIIQNVNRHRGIKKNKIRYNNNLKSAVHQCHFI